MESNNNNNNNQSITPTSSSSQYPTPLPLAPQAPPILHYHVQQQQQLQQFWAFQRQEIEHVTEFKNHQLPLARIKKIMKADEDVRMISAEAPILFSKACELFILELTIRSWIHAEENKRRTLQKNDIAAAITRNDIFDFLVDIVPRDEGVVGPVGDGMDYFYPDPGMMPMVDNPNAGMYMNQPSQAWQSVWQMQGGGDDDGTYGTGGSQGTFDGQGGGG